MRNKRVLALALVMVMLLLCNCSKSEETAQQFSVLETTGIEQVATTETLSTETTEALEELDNETTQQFSTPETIVTEQVYTTETINTEITKALEELDGETTQQFSTSETNVTEQVVSTETLSPETTGVLEEFDDETAQQFSTPETTVTEQVVTTENITTETTEALEQLDNEYNPIFEQIYCDIVTNMYVDNVDINWEYEYENDMLIIKKIKNGFSEEYKSIEAHYYDDGGLDWLEAEKAWSYQAIDLENDYENIETIAIARGYDGPIKLYFEDENGTDYMIYYCGLMLYTRVEDGDVQNEWQYWGMLDNGSLAKIREILPPFDNYGESVIISTFTFVNLSDETQNFHSNIKVRAYQGGIECSDIVFVPDLDTEQLTDIKPNNSITIWIPFKLRDEYTPIEIEISDRYSDTVLASKTFEIP